jgi:hypothetical protein
LAHHAKETRKIFAFNLSAEYICQKFGDHIKNFLPYVDFLFSNEQVRYRIKLLHAYKLILGSKMFCSTSYANERMST